ncbi:MAG: hypothetical protein ACE14M_06445 [Terriglobales bacterium]
MSTTEQSIGTVTQAVKKDTCPVCSVLRQVQTDIVKYLEPDGANVVCNFHGWAVAHAAPAESVAAIFGRLLESLAESKPSTRCDLCDFIREQEERTLEELSREFASRALFVEWMRKHGSLCLRHAVLLKNRLPDALQLVVTQIVARNIAELRGELQAFNQRVRLGEHSGGGLLGRVAEFLLSQRGIIRSDFPAQWADRSH